MVKLGLIVPTLNAGVQWGDWLNALGSQTCQSSRKLLLDSSSQDATVSLAEKYDFQIKVIDQSDFNHGATRQYGLSLLGNVDIVVYLTQDAILANEQALCRILSPFEDPSVAAVCGRQLPRQTARFIEAHARLYNYPSVSSVRSISDVTRYGLKTAFISNSFAAYRVSALYEADGFPADVIFGEDMYVASKILQAGYKIAYAADACVYHSHDYSLPQEFRRYFDMGVFHAREPWIRELLGGAEGEGLKFVRSELAYLLKRSFWRIPEALVRKLLAYLGFRLGLLEGWLPVCLKRRLAMNKGYFRK